MKNKLTDVTVSQTIYIPHSLIHYLVDSNKQSTGGLIITQQHVIYCRSEYRWVMEQWLHSHDTYKVIQASQTNSLLVLWKNIPDLPYHGHTHKTLYL